VHQAFGTAFAQNASSNMAGVEHDDLHAHSPRLGEVTAAERLSRALKEGGHRSPLIVAFRDRIPEIGGRGAVAASLGFPRELDLREGFVELPFVLGRPPTVQGVERRPNGRQLPLEVDEFGGGEEVGLRANRKLGDNQGDCGIVFVAGRECFGGEFHLQRELSPNLFAATRVPRQRLRLLGRVGARHHEHWEDEQREPPSAVGRWVSSRVAWTFEHGGILAEHDVQRAKNPRRRAP